MASGSNHRERIVAAAADLLVAEGRQGVTTRAVSALASVQPPTIYRLFGDMHGLLDAVAADGFSRYLDRKAGMSLTADPVEDLRRGWDLHVGFGVEFPAHYRLMYVGERPRDESHAMAESHRMLVTLVRRIGEAGLLVVDVEQAAEMVHAAGLGVALQLIQRSATTGDDPLSVRTREAIIGAITAASEKQIDTEPGRRAIALRAVLDGSEMNLSAGERLLLDELLGKISTSGDHPTG